jgi:hypothetical protein
VLLVPLVVLCVVLPAWAISLHARVLRDVRAITKALQQRELPTASEAARLVDLRIDLLRRWTTAYHATAASIGELEDRMERAHLLARDDEATGTLRPGAPGGAVKDGATGGRRPMVTRSGNRGIGD